MKVTKHAISALAVGAVLALAGCGGTSSKGSGSAGSESEPMTATQAEETQAESDYVVTIDGARVTEDYSGDKVVVVTFTFTNNSDDAQAFLYATSVDVYQNGVELDLAFLSDIESNGSNKIKPGASITTEQAYKLNDMSEIEVEVSELFSFSDGLLASQTFTLE